MKRTVLATALLAVMSVYGPIVSGLFAQATAENPKCLFLKGELTKVKGAPMGASGSSTPGDRPARFLAEATAGILEGKIASCTKGEKLLSAGRLRRIEAARMKQVEQVRQELQGAAADAVVDRLNRLYEEEAKSFFNQDAVKIAVLDRDVFKDFPDVLRVLQESSLDEGQKAAIVKNFRYIKYEEAGRLHNSLRGIDKDTGATFPYILRGELADRAEAEIKQREKDEKTQAENLKKAQLQARLTLSISMIVVVALGGFLLFRRELFPLQVYLTIVGAAVVLGVGWILFTLGLWEWIQGYLNIAF